MNYIAEKVFTRINIFGNVTLEIIESFISDVPYDNRMTQNLAFEIDKADYNCRGIYFSSN